MEHLIRTRDLLKNTLHESTQIDSKIHQTTTNLTRINHTFPFLETHITNIASKSAMNDHLHRALPPVSAVFKVYQVVDELGSLLSSTHPSSNLKLHISLLKKLQQALTLLTNTCNLAIPWVEDIKRLLYTETAMDDHLLHLYHSHVCKTLCILKKLQTFEHQSLQTQGIVNLAFQELEKEFRNLLINNSSPLELPSSLFSSGDEESDVSDSSPEALSSPVVQKLQAIVACFVCNDMVDRCMPVYIQVRGKIVQRSLEGLDLDYLAISLTEFDSVQEIEGYIDEWGRHMEFVVKHLLELEYNLCNQVFGHEMWADCFSKIALHSGIQGFIKFGNTVTKCKKEAIKLFKLLDIFSTLNDLRQDFNRIFGGKPCSEIQTQTRDLIKKVVNGACEIFRELSKQVNQQRLTDPPPDGTVPRLVTFVTEYANELLDDDYRPELEQVLKIHHSWHNANGFTKGLVRVEIQNIVKSLEVNLEKWAKRYEDVSLSYIFMMNTSCYLSKHLKDTKLGDLMGESWIKTHEDRVKYYTSLYLKENWGRTPSLLINKERMKGFNETFDQVYRKRSGWVEN